VLVVFAFSMMTLLPVALFGLVAASTWLALECFAADKLRGEERLDDFREGPKRKAAAEITSKKADAMTRVLERAAPMAKPLQPKNEAEQGKLKVRLLQAGFSGESTPSVLLGLKFIGLLCGFVIGGGLSLLFYGFSLDALYRTVIVAGGLFYLPDLVLVWLTRRRKEAIFLGLPDALDLMVVCVESGLGLDQAMRKVSEEMKKSYRVIAEEFGLCNLHLQMGASRANVLHDLGQRTGVDDLRSLASILIQADKFGSSIAQALRVQSESMRTRRKQLAEEKAAKTAVKLIFPLVLFIFPGIFVVLVGPAAITMIREMLPRMGG